MITQYENIKSKTHLHGNFDSMKSNIYVNHLYLLKNETFSVWWEMDESHRF